MWGLNGGSARIAIHVGYPLGAMIGPLIAMPFVMNTPEVDDSSSASGQDIPPPGVNESSSFLKANASNIPQTVESIDDTSRIEIAYGIVASLIVSMAAVFLFLQCCVKTPSQPIAERGRQLSFRDVWRPSVWADGDSCYGVAVTLFLIAYFVLLMGAAIGTQVYLVTYAADSGMLTNQKAALLNSLTFGAGSVYCTHCTISEELLLCYAHVYSSTLISTRMRIILLFSVFFNVILLLQALAHA